MKAICKKGFVLAVALCFSTFLMASQAKAEDEDITYSLTFTEQELDDLLAPIALYPDPLLAQILPAATYPNDIADADRWLNSGGSLSSIDDQNWDESVKVIARYPDVLRMMADSMDWTANLGDAFLNQPEDVANAIQRLRQQARDMGNLVSNDKQEVDIAGDSIAIVPVQPEYVYVPAYDPVVVYVQRSPRFSPPFIIFGPPLLLGAWLTMDFDWGQHHVIYHGWNRSGWVNHARPFVHVTNVYINKSRPLIRQEWRHDPSRVGPARYLASHPSGPNANRYARTGEVRGRTAIHPAPVGTMFGPKGDTHSFSNRGRESRGIVNQQPSPPTPRIDQRRTIPSPVVSGRRIMPTPGSSQRPVQPGPSISERQNIPVPTVSQRPITQTPLVSSSGLNQPRPARESVQPARAPSVTFGGYRGGNEANAQSLRGQVSRQSTVGTLHITAPTVHENAPSGRDGHGDKQRR